MGYITGPGTVPGAPADLLASGLNMSVGAWRLSPSATEIELLLMRWFAEMYGMPPESAGGLFVSGGAMANFVALKAARDAMANWDVRNYGVRWGAPLRVYGSDEMHVVVDRAADMLGIGFEGVCRIPVDDRFRIRVDALAEAIERDRQGGMLPMAVVATAGTVLTGAVDPLDDLADLCGEKGLWFHVDAAYGGPAVLAEDLRPLFRGIERADSIAFDAHKWMYLSHPGGCILVRDWVHLLAAFAVAPSYAYEDKELSGHGMDLALLGPQFSRSFQAFKVWVSLLAHGRRAYGARISHDAALARYMGARVEQRAEFELVCPVGLSVCCFRFVPQDLPDGPGRDGYLDQLNEHLMTAIQMDGRAFCSNAWVGGRATLRACIVNFRTEAEDVDALLDVAAEIGAQLDGELRPDSLKVISTM